MIAINRSSNSKSFAQLTITGAFPFRIKDMPIPTCKTGFVYFLISIKTPEATYIGETRCLKTRLSQHNSGSGSIFTAKHRPYAVIAYICGFCGNKPLRRYVEEHWKIKRDQLKKNGNMSQYDWALQGQAVINEIDSGFSFREYHNQLKLVLLCNNEQH